MMGRVRDLVEELDAGAVTCADAPVWALPDADLAGCLDAAHRLEQAAAALKAHLVRQIDLRHLPAAQGRGGVARWLHARLHLDPQAARELVETATTLDRYPHLDRAYRAGAVHTRQVTAIGSALDDLPTDLDPPIADRAQTTLVHWAHELEPAKLRRIGARILEHVAPDLADQHDEAALRREEQRARRRRTFTLSTPFHGTVRVSGYLPVEDAAVVRAALDPLCAPRPGDPRTPGQQRADALIDVCRLTLTGGQLPDNGGERPQIAVTVSYDALRDQLPQARLDTGETLSAGTARRLACDAHILPIVLGGASQILDVGRSRRLTTKALRRALVARDHGCTFPGCDRPPRWTAAHHLTHWADGGPTNLDNLTLLCGEHHHLIHDGDWQTRLGDDHHPEFIPPAYLDTTRRPRRNIFHHRT
jgi:hypothetical protein